MFCTAVLGVCGWHRLINKAVAEKLPIDKQRNGGITEHNI